MSRWKRVGCAGLVGLACIVAVPVAVVGSAFVGTSSLEDGRTYADGRVTTVVDLYVGCFLVDVGNGDYVLVDGCLDSDGTAVQAALAQRGATLDDVVMMLLTHGHSDHIGVMGALPTLEVRVMADERPALVGEQPYRGLLPSLMGRVDSGIRAVALSDEDRFQVGDTFFEAFAVPGHTDGSGAFLAHGVLFVGDSASAAGSGDLLGSPWVFSNDSALNQHALQALAARVSQQQVDWVVPAHSGPAKLEALRAFRP